MQLAHQLVGPESAPALVLIHGITENHESWRPLIDVWQSNHRVLAVDLRGHGSSPVGDTYDTASYAADVAETVAVVGLSDPLVVGHSLGGVVATAYAAVADCCAIVNVDQSLHLAAFKEALEALEPMLRGSEAEFRTAIEMIFSQMAGPLQADEVGRIGRLRRPDRDVVLDTWAQLFESSIDELDLAVAHMTAPVRVPYLSLHGIDPGEEYPGWLTARIPTATVEVWADFGHYPHLADPTRFVARLAEFEAQVRR